MLAHLLLHAPWHIGGREWNCSCQWHCSWLVVSWKRSQLEHCDSCFSSPLFGSSSFSMAVLWCPRRIVCGMVHRHAHLQLLALASCQSCQRRGGGVGPRAVGKPCVLVVRSADFLCGMQVGLTVFALFILRTDMAYLVSLTYGMLMTGFSAPHLQLFVRKWRLCAVEVLCCSP